MEAGAGDTRPASAWGEVRLHWRPLLACSVGIGLGLSPLPPFTAGLFATALEGEFGWMRGEILATIMFVTASLFVLGPFLGRLVDRRGARVVALWSTIGLGLSIAAMSLVTAQIWTFYLCWAVMAVVAIGTLPITYARVITSWFDKGRGLALGIALASTGITGAFAQFYIQWLIDDYGWRVAYLGLAALPLVIAVPILWLFLIEPEPSATGQAEREGPGATVAEALRHYRLWALSVAALALGAGTGGLIPNYVPLLTGGGVPMATALKAMSALAISVIAGRIVTGFLLDRFSGPIVGSILIAPAIAGLALLASFPAEPSSAWAAAVTVGLIAGAEFDLVAYMTSRYFGRRHFSEIYGIQYAIFGLGAGASPAGYGLLRDLTGGYFPLMATSMALFALAIAALLTLGRYPARYAPE